MSLSVSVIIPAYNAAATISKTLESIINQSNPNWEAVVIDDGSTGNTIEIIQDFIKRENRIRLISQVNSGVAEVRNNGIKAAKFDWLLFLDSDDWVAQTLFEKISGVIAADESLGAVHFGWCLVAPDGTSLGEKYAYPREDMFPSFAGSCVFPIHACIIRKNLAAAVDGFDSSLKLFCADWDFWQRVCRAGLRFGFVREVFACYRMQQNSLSRSVEESYRVSLKIIDQGYSYDTRVSNSLPEYSNGANRDQLPLQKLYCAIWNAGMLIGQGKNATKLLELLGNDCSAALDPQQVADYIFESVCYSTCQLSTAWAELWTKYKEFIFDFTSALENKAQSPGLVSNTIAFLERLIVKDNLGAEPLLIGNTYGTRIEATKPINDITIQNEATRLFCVIEIEGITMGSLEVPISNRFVSGKTIIQAIDNATAWKILGKFFEYTLYPRIIHDQQAMARKYGVKTVEEFHEKYGWTYFLQQFWNRPSWPGKRFYDSNYWELKRAKQVSSDEISSIELTNDLPNIIVVDDSIKLSVRLAGLGVGTIRLPVKGKRIKAQALRVAITKSLGLELCRVCVQQALIGRPVNEITTLKERLQQTIGAEIRSHRISVHREMS